MSPLHHKNKITRTETDITVAISLRSPLLRRVGHVTEKLIQKGVQTFKSEKSNGTPGSQFPPLLIERAGRAADCFNSGSLPALPESDSDSDPSCVQADLIPNLLAACERLSMCNNADCKKAKDELRTLSPLCPSWPAFYDYCLQLAACVCSAKQPIEQNSLLGRALLSLVVGITDQIPTDYTRKPSENKSEPARERDNQLTEFRLSESILVKLAEVLPLASWVYALSRGSYKFLYPNSSGMSVRLAMKDMNDAALVRLNQLGLCRQRYSVLPEKIQGGLYNISAFVPPDDDPLISSRWKHDGHEDCTARHCGPGNLSTTEISRTHEAGCDKRCGARSFNEQLLLAALTKKKPTAWSFLPDLTVSERLVGRLAVGREWAGRSGKSLPVEPTTGQPSNAPPSSQAPSIQSPSGPWRPACEWPAGECRPTFYWHSNPWPSRSSWSKLVLCGARSSETPETQPPMPLSPRKSTGVDQHTAVSIPAAGPSHTAGGGKASPDRDPPTAMQTPIPDQNSISLSDVAGHQACDNPSARSNQPYMAISHSWADGTGDGGKDGERGLVNNCRYKLFIDIARQHKCSAIWWDAICVPQRASNESDGTTDARNIALATMHNNYANAKVTLVHDLYLRNFEWVDAPSACYAVVMSPWFSRGWTALELACTMVIKVLFKGGVIKDLHQDIIARARQVTSPLHLVSTTAIAGLIRNDLSEMSNYKPVWEGAGPPGPSYQAFPMTGDGDGSYTEMIGAVKPFSFGPMSSIDHLITALGPRFTSRNSDIPIIAGHLMQVEVPAKPDDIIEDLGDGLTGSVTDYDRRDQDQITAHSARVQQAINIRIWRSLNSISIAHLFHDQDETMTAPGFRWAPLDIMSLPAGFAGQANNLLKLHHGGELEGVWRVVCLAGGVAMTVTGRKKWRGMEVALENNTKDHVMLIRYDVTTAQGVIVRVMYPGAVNVNPNASLAVRFVGFVTFKSDADMTMFPATRVKIGEMVEVANLPSDQNVCKYLSEVRNSQIYLKDFTPRINAPWCGCAEGPVVTGVQVARSAWAGLVGHASPV